MVSRRTSPARSCSRAAARRHRGEGGYVLTLVLAVTLFLALILVALLGLVTTDMNTSSSYGRAAAVRRAADGALGVGVTRLKTMLPADLAAGDGCGTVSGTSVALDGRTVTLGCSAVPTTDRPVASPGSGGTVLTLLGNYNGTLDDGVYNEVGGIMQPVVAGIASWLNGLVANGPGLIHGGNDTLRIVGDVKVRQSTLGVVPGKYPAIDVTGSYAQGDRGFLGGLDFGFFGATKPCGVLTEKVGDVDYGLRLRATSTPTCLSGSAADRDSVSPALPASPPVAKSWDQATIAGSAQSAGTCAPGTVKIFSPGSYSAAQTAQMNKWFLQGDCDNVTFWFQPGDYYFETSGIWDNDPRALVLNDPTSNWVFGVPKGWNSGERAAADDFPEACDRTADGVSITLSSSTSIKHKAGQVAICGRRSGAQELPAIYQAAAVGSQAWAGEPDTATTVAAAPGTLTFTSPADASKTVAGPAPAPAIPADYPTYGKPFDNSEGTTEASRRSATMANPCTAYCAVGLTFSGFGNPAQPAPSGTLASAQLRLRGTATNVTTNYYDSRTETMVQVAFNDGSGGGCTVHAKDVPRDNATFVVDLKKPWTDPMPAGYTSATFVHNCPTVLTDASQLEKATVTVYEVLIPQVYCPNWFSCTTLPAKVTLDYGYLQTVTASVAPASPFGMVEAPASNTSFNVFGPMFLPQSQVEVKWSGDATAFPAVVGSITARGLASTPLTSAGSGRGGVLVARALAAPRRHLVLTATIDGKVRGTADVVIGDVDPTSGVYRPGQSLDVVSWKI